MEPPPVQYVKTRDDISIAFSVSGAGLPLVVLPIQFNHLQLAWQTGTATLGAPAWLAAFASKFRLVTYDARCQGLSTRGCPASDWVEGDLEDLSAVVDGLRLDRFVLFAPYMRTHTAVHYAVRNPERVRALVLSGVIISAANGLLVSGASLAKRDWEFFLRSNVGVGTPPDLAEQILSYYRGSITQADWLHCIEAFAVSDIGEPLGQVRRPTLVLHPRRQPYASQEDAATAAAAIPGAQLVMIDDDGYPGGSPGAALEAMQAFLRDIVADEGRHRGEGTLSPREVEVLGLVAEGKTNREIAEALVISERTVINHLSNIFAKTGAENRAGAAAYALRHGLV